jgi:hypothetical protein
VNVCVYNKKVGDQGEVDDCMQQMREPVGGGTRVNVCMYYKEVGGGQMEVDVCMW